MVARRYGIKTLALKQLKQLIATIVCDENRLRSARLATFAQLVGTVEPEASPRSVAVFVKFCGAYAQCADAACR